MSIKFNFSLSDNYNTRITDLNDTFKALAKFNPSGASGLETGMFRFYNNKIEQYNGTAWEDYKFNELNVDLIGDKSGNGVKFTNTIGIGKTSTGGPFILDILATNQGIRLDSTVENSYAVLFTSVNGILDWSVGRSSLVNHPFTIWDETNGNARIIVNHGTGTPLTINSDNSVTFSGHIKSSTPTLISGAYSNFNANFIGTSGGYTISYQDTPIWALLGNVSNGHFEYYRNTGSVESTNWVKHFGIDSSGNFTFAGNIITGPGTIFLKSTDDDANIICGGSIASSNNGAYIGLYGSLNPNPDIITMAMGRNSGSAFIRFLGNDGSGNGVERMRLTADGKLGLGVLSPGNMLDIYDDDSTIYTSSSGNIANFRNVNTTDNTYAGIALTATGSGTSVGVANILAQVTANGTADTVFTNRNNGGYVETLRIKSDGRITTRGEFSPDVTLGGLCLNQGANDGNILTFKSSDVAHGMTYFAETDTYALFKKKSSDYGGLEISGFGETNCGINIKAYVTTDNTIYGANIIEALYKSGTGITDIPNYMPIVSFNNNNSPKVIINGNGSIGAVDGNTGTFHRVACGGGSYIYGARPNTGSVTLRINGVEYRLMTCE